MLRELRIRDIAIIEDVSVRFGVGLNVLSGETGAGKSIILGALGLVLGARGSAEMVRSGRDSAEVSALFDRTDEAMAALAALDVTLDDSDDGLLVRRVITATGRSRAYLGATAVSLGDLRQVASSLVDYASQHEHQVLLDEGRHRLILDRFADHAAQVAVAAAAVEAVRVLLDERARLATREEQRRERIDYLTFQIDELDRLKPVAGEEAALEDELRVVRSAARLSKRAREAERALYGGDASAVERLGVAVKAVRELAETDSSLAPLRESTEAALFAAEDAARALGSYAQRTRHDPVREQELAERLASLHQLKRKHRTDADGLVALRGRMRAELDELEGLDERRGGIALSLAAARRDALHACAPLTASRSAAALRLAAKVEAELASLAMPSARFSPQVEPLPPGEGVALGDGGPFANSGGADAVRFLFSANAGEEARALVRVASGGELSRILLSLRRALAGTLSVQVQVCVFDEIDSGMGGATAETVAEKLVEIAREGQVLAITHLPRIAAAAAHHFRVEKSVVLGRTRTDVVPLGPEARVGELMRMVAGTATTEAAEVFARELLTSAQASAPASGGLPSLP